MMKTGKSTFALVVPLIITGCSKETLEVAPQSRPREEKSYSMRESNTVVSKPQAKTCCESFKTVILATNSNLPRTRRGKTDSVSENSFVEKLENMDISDENRDSISFFSMNEKEQTAFLDNITLPL